MDQLFLALKILNGYFGWNKARMTCFVGMLLALFKVRTINLTELACGFLSNATLDSRYKRIKRFFKDFEIEFSLVASWVIQFFGLTNKPLYLSMDRTNWQWGKKNINILMLSITYKGIAIPLFWNLLDKKGNSNTKGAYSDHGSIYYASGITFYYTRPTKTC